jgi:hypothetical protein
MHKLLPVSELSAETGRSLYMSSAMYYEVNLLDDIFTTLRQYSSGEAEDNNEKSKPSSLHDALSLTATPTCLWFSNGKLKRIFHYNCLDLMNEVSAATWTASSPFQLLALSRYCRKANWPLLPPRLRAMAAGAAPCTRAKQNSTEIKINTLNLVCCGLRVLDHHSVFPHSIPLSLAHLIRSLW